MNDTNRFLLFWLVCIPTRVAFAHFDFEFKRIIALIVALYWLSGVNKDENTGFFQGKAWWKEFRPIHGLLWLLFAITNSNVWLYLDIVLGLYAYSQK